MNEWIVGLLTIFVTCWLLSWTVNTELIYKTQQQRIVCNKLVTEIWWFSIHGLVISLVFHVYRAGVNGTPGVTKPRTPGLKNETRGWNPYSQCCFIFASEPIRRIVALYIVTQLCAIVLIHVSECLIITTDMLYWCGYAGDLHLLNTCARGVHCRWRI